MNIQSYIIAISEFLNVVIMPFLIALAGLFFMWNAYRYFILGGSNEESQQKAKILAFWGIGGIVLIISLWGIVNLLVEGLGLGNDENDTLTPDFIQRVENT